MTDLANDYEDLGGRSPRERGRLLPVLVGRLLERDGYETRLNAGAASPRDADAFASSMDGDYLVEVKGTTRPAGIDVVDSLLTRLEGMPVPTIGLIFSRPGFTRGAVDRVRARRNRPVLLVNGEELSELFDTRLNLRALIAAKRRALTRDARVAFFSGATLLELPTKDAVRPLPNPNVVFPESDPLVDVPLMVSLGPNHDFVFAAEIPDVNWTIALGSGACLDVDLPISSLDDLEGVLELLRRAGWITPSGRFAIHQTKVSWHGAGAKGLINALRRQAARNQSVRDFTPHNEEHAVYFDVFGGGFYTLVLRVVVKPEPWLLGAQLSMHLPGIPLDPSPLRLTMRSLGLEDQAAFRCLGEEGRHNEVRFAPDVVPLRVDQALEATDAYSGHGETWFSAVVGENPFLEPAMAPKLPEAVRSALEGCDKVVCALGSWYDADSRPRRFYVKRIESVWTASAQVLVVAADWKETPPAEREAS